MEVALFVYNEPHFLLRYAEFYTFILSNLISHITYEPSEAGIISL